MMQHPCNRFGFGLNAAAAHNHQVNYPTMHYPSNYPSAHHPMVNHHNQQHHQVDNYSATAVGTNGMLMDAAAAHGSVHHHHHKPTNPWPAVPVSVPVNVSLPQQFNHLMHRNASTGGDLPLTPPADRDAAAAAAAAATAASSPAVPSPATTSAPSYYPMLHGPSASYTQSPVIDKSMTPPQEMVVSHHQHHHHHQHIQHHQYQEPIGWSWTPATSAAPPTPSSSSPSTATSSSLGHVSQGVNGGSASDFAAFHHHQMMTHHAHHHQHQHAVQPPASSSSSGSSNNSIVSAPPSVSAPHQNPSEFQQRVAAALLKTHATLSSRRCRRCRCPNCQVNSKHNAANITTKQSSKSKLIETNLNNLFN